MNDKMECVSCLSKADRVLVHKETKYEYGFCSKCEEKEFYNKEVFDCKIK